jgi:myo-inositol-1(or 4)-monophosphatase
MRVLFQGAAGVAEQALLDAQERLRYLWCSELCRLPLRHSADTNQRWSGSSVRCDLQCEEIVRGALSALPFPISIVSEESPPLINAAAEVAFLVDPLDATHNACAGYPAFTASVAMFSRDVCVFAWVYDLSRDVAYVAAAGKGAFMKTSLIAERMRARSITSLDEAAISFLRARESRSRRVLQSLLWQAAKIRLSSCSSLDLCLIASGTLDAFIDISIPGHERSCDIAAASLLLQEAGGCVMTPEGTPRLLCGPHEKSLRDYAPTVAFGSPATAGAIFRALRGS